MITAPLTVRVHEVLDFEHSDVKYRYCISVDMKFREADATRGWAWAGYSKAEATREAKKLAAKISDNRNRLDAAKDWGDKTAIQLATSKWEKATRRYVATIC